METTRSYFPGFTPLSTKPPLPVVLSPTDALFKKTLALVTGLVSAWFKIRPVIVTCAHTAMGSAIAINTIVILKYLSIVRFEVDNKEPEHLKSKNPVR